MSGCFGTLTKRDTYYRDWYQNSNQISKYVGPHKSPARVDRGVAVVDEVLWGAKHLQQVILTLQHYAEYESSSPEDGNDNPTSKEST